MLLCSLRGLHKDLSTSSSYLEVKWAKKTLSNRQARFNYAKQVVMINQATITPWLPRTGQIFVSQQEWLPVVYSHISISINICPASDYVQIGRELGSGGCLFQTMKYEVRTPPSLLKLEYGSMNLGSSPCRNYLACPAQCHH